MGRRCCVGFGEVMAPTLRVPLPPPPSALVCSGLCVCAPHRLVPQTIGVWGQLSSQGGVLVEPPLCFQITVTGLVSVEWSQ